MKIGGTLSAWELAKASFRFVWSHRAAYLRAAAVPCLASALCSLISGEVKQAAVRMAFHLPSLMFTAILAVKWHRYYLLGPEVGRPSWVPCFGARELRFWLYLLMVWAGGFLAIMVLMELLGSLFGSDLFLLFSAILLVPLFLFLWGRLALIFPAVAVGVGGGVAGHVEGSWRSMSDWTWNVVGATILVSIAVALVFVPITWFLGELHGVLGTIMGFLVGTAELAVITGVMVTVLSIAFDDLTPWREGRLVKGKK